MKNLPVKRTIFLISSIVFLHLGGYSQKKRFNPGNILRAGAIVAEDLKSANKKQNAFGNKSQGRDTAAVLNFNTPMPANQFAASGIQDISGVWEGEQSNGNLIMYYKLCLNKINGDNTYSGYDYCVWVKNIDHSPITK